MTFLLFSFIFYTVTENLHFLSQSSNKVCNFSHKICGHQLKTKIKEKILNG